MSMLWCTVKVKNMNESLHFYQEIVGLELVTRFQTGPTMDLAFLGTGETKLELICDTNIASFNIGSDITIGFEVESVEEKIIFLKEHNIEVVSGIISPNPHTKFFYIKDPNGLGIQFVERTI